MSEHHRMTRQRRVILEELRRLSTHPTADEMYGIVRKRIPKISLGTVYRNLEMLAETGTIRIVRTCGRQMRFDADLSDHVHAVCVRCGKVIDMPGASPAVHPGIPGPAGSGFRQIATRTEIIGVCADCTGGEAECEG